jgi:hypothetical protein
MLLAIGIRPISDVVLATSGGSCEVTTVKPLHYFKTESDYTNFLETLEKNITNPYLNNQIENGFVSGRFEESSRGKTRRNFKSTTRFTRKRKV